MTTLSGKARPSLGETEIVYLLLTDPDGNIIFANKAIHDQYPLTNSTSSGIHISELIFSGDRLKARSLISSITTSRYELAEYTESLHLDRREASRHWRFYPIFSPGREKITSLLCVSSLETSNCGETKAANPNYKPDQYPALNSIGLDLNDPSYYVGLLLEYTDNAFFLMDTNLNVVFYNQAAAEYYRSGFGKELHRGFHFPEIIPQELRDVRRKMLHEKVLLGQTVETIGNMPSLGGQRIFHNIYRPILNANADVIGICLIADDISEREKAKNELLKSERFFKSLISDSLDGIALTDTEGRISYMAASCRKILGFEPEELVGKNCFEFIHPGDIPLARSGFHDEIMRTPQARYYELRMKRKSGEWVWMMVRAHNMLEDAAVNSIVIFFSDITSRREADLARKKAESQSIDRAAQINSILHSITDGFAAIDRQLNIILWNHTSESMTGRTAESILQKNILTIFPQFVNSPIHYRLQAAMDNSVSVNFTEYLRDAHSWIEFSAYPSAQVLFVYFRDVTKRKQQEMMLELEREVFEMNTRIGGTLRNTMDYFLHGIEKVYPDMICSVMALDEEEEHLFRFSTPGLPKEYMDLIDGAETGVNAGSCGTSAHRRELVVVSDIETDPLWIKYKSIALKFGLRACWSVPVISHEGRVLATFAVYYKTIKSPTEDEINAISKFAGILAILMEKEIAEARLKISNERYKFATLATNEAIWDWDLKTNEIYWGDGFKRLFGYSFPKGKGSYEQWLTCLHPDDRAIVDKCYEGIFLRDKNSNIIETEYRFLKWDGSYADIVDIGYLLFNENGEAFRMVGSMRDITDFKRLQAQLLQQELGRQKMVIEAAIGAQEKERAEIGKELHDNINQVLSTTKLYLDLAKTDEDRRMELLQMSSRNINNAIIEIRNLSHSLVPPSLKDLGLVESIFDLIGKIRLTQSFNIEFDFSDLSLEKYITLDQKLTLYRIVQEQFNNIIKHADANVVNILLSLEEDSIRLLMEDDGKGFDPVLAKKGVGLNNIFNRAAFHDGTALLESAPGKGCRLRVAIPVIKS
jgi:PAS domain S-box-containing protein